MGIKQLYNDNLRKLPNEYGDVSGMIRLHYQNFAYIHIILKSKEDAILMYLGPRGYANFVK